jgi:hypothetical protein
MSQEKHPHRIPLPPVLLSIVPWLAMLAGAAIGLTITSSNVGLFVGAIAGFGGAALWTASRVRGDRR